jgi:hypothetical protein
MRKDVVYLGMIRWNDSMNLNTSDEGYNNGKKYGQKGTICGPNSKRIRCGVEEIGARREGRTLAICRVSDNREEGLKPSLLVTRKWRCSLTTSWSQLRGG